MTPRESISEVCRRTNERHCHICENADCSDNRTSSIVLLLHKVKKASQAVKQAEEERDRVAESYHKLAERFSDLENAVVKGLIVFGGKATPLKEMVDAVGTADALQEEEER